MADRKIFQNIHIIQMNFNAVRASYSGCFEFSQDEWHELMVFFMNNGFDDCLYLWQQSEWEIVYRSDIIQASGYIRICGDDKYKNVITDFNLLSPKLWKMIVDGSHMKYFIPLKDVHVVKITPRNRSHLRQLTDHEKTWLDNLYVPFRKAANLCICNNHCTYGYTNVEVGSAPVLCLNIYNM